jgi:hypothetical protein
MQRVKVGVVHCDEFASRQRTPISIEAEPESVQPWFT